LTASAPLQAQEIVPVSPLYEVDALRREVYEIDPLIRCGELTADLPVFNGSNPEGWVEMRHLLEELAQVAKARRCKL